MAQQNPAADETATGGATRAKRRAYNLAGMASDVKRRTDKNGEPYATARFDYVLRDGTAAHRTAMAFGDAFRAIDAHLAESAPVRLYGVFDGGILRVVGLGRDPAPKGGGAATGRDEAPAAPPSPPHGGVVIMHHDMGVHVGVCMGLGFWSLLDPAGQPSACTFEDEAQARAHVASWDGDNDPDGYGYVPVTTASPLHATIAELKEAGLGDWLGTMEEDALRHAKPAGNA